MRLLNTHTLSFEEFYGNLPKYAILSHTWGSEEVTFQDWADSSSMKHKSGYTKIVEACKQAKSDGYLYAWVDTNCIDKTSSAELTEAINSMFAWYNRAGICYAYLSDVPTFNPISFAEAFRRSRWFKRGWTLQELLAPEEVVFYAADWSRIGTKATLVREIAAATGINIEYLCPEKRAVAATRDDWTKRLHITCHEASVAERMSWLARRETTRIEDMAYCMLGIFGISMPLLYGEGQGAFLRLQEEILKSSDDHSLFCWSWTMDEGQSSLLSLRPHSFLEATHYRRSRSNEQPSPYSMTNAGLSIRLPMIRCWSSHIIVLNVQIPDTNEYAGISVSGDLSSHLFSRGSYPDTPIPLYITSSYYDRLGMSDDSNLTDMFFPTRQFVPKSIRHLSPRVSNHYKAGALLSFSSRDQFTAIETFPPDRFSESDSILGICPTDDTAVSDWVRGWTQPDTAFVGATIVKFSLKHEFGEMVLFAITSEKAGSYLMPQWHCFNLAPFIPRNYIDSLDLAKFASQYSRDLEGLVRSPGHTDDTSNHSSRISCGIAASGFTTTAASVLKHIHISYICPDNSC